MGGVDECGYMSPFPTRGRDITSVWHVSIPEAGNVVVVASNLDTWRRKPIERCMIRSRYSEHVTRHIALHLETTVPPTLFDHAMSLLGIGPPLEAQLS